MEFRQFNVIIQLFFSETRCVYYITRKTDPSVKSNTFYPEQLVKLLKKSYKQTLLTVHG